MEGEQRAGLFRVPFHIPSFHGLRTLGVYLSGILYALGFWIFLDAVLYSKHANASDLHVTFIDWIPFLCSTLGMVIVSAIEKNRLMDYNNGDFGGNEAIIWQARTVLFLGLALLAGGLSGSIVVLIIKFVIKDYTTYPTVGMGINNVLGNIFILLSCVVLWIAQNAEDEYSYSLTI
ncbi:hypothetical protein KAFR_0C01730 [Kazachstania africana CBS 2517]|uniref:Vacuolar protein sorting-associated protein 68 n=1 Tax=Kazachstania africana (strain ATCC 22294 / BCRC 22015 / CBS 2517 / CECT 1963 / NBRC 1671 / NRRL Y-8276) TaxID=1071382 RepID=H2AS16_KAZAF|nr:hypothetical protein KAFR_0C01730 [Kazachstania africana CBS 2517]CCF57166.1 hypothetical protein KAFR_0C01730 [Kazachstania africana CBS 2517]